MKSPSSRAARALSHILLFEQIWLACLRGEENKSSPPDFFPDLPLGECEALINESLENYKVYLRALTEEQLDAVQSYRTLAGDQSEATTREVLNHVMMHSMYHRGQVALAIREDGGEPLQSDFILFVRERCDKPKSLSDNLSYE